MQTVIYFLSGLFYLGIALGIGSNSLIFTREFYLRMGFFEGRGCYNLFIFAAFVSVSFALKGPDFFFLAVCLGAWGSYFILEKGFCGELKLLCLSLGVMGSSSLGVLILIIGSVAFYS